MGRDRWGGRLREGQVRRKAEEGRVGEGRLGEGQVGRKAEERRVGKEG